MAHSLQRRWAMLVKSYSRLDKLYKKSLQREEVLATEVRALRAEAADLRRAQKEYQRASKNTMERLFATTRYAIAHLHDAHDYVAEEKLSIWLETMLDSMQPVANVDHLIALLEEWCQSLPFDDPDRAVAVWMKTTMMLNELRGQDAGPETGN